MGFWLGGRRPDGPPLRRREREGKDPWRGISHLLARGNSPMFFLQWLPCGEGRWGNFVASVGRIRDFPYQDAAPYIVVGVGMECVWRER